MSKQKAQQTSATEDAISELRALVVQFSSALVLAEAGQFSDAYFTLPDSVLHSVPNIRNALGDAAQTAIGQKPSSELKSFVTRINGVMKRVRRGADGSLRPVY